jgi:hypothetical protein
MFNQVSSDFFSFGILKSASIASGIHQHVDAYRISIIIYVCCKYVFLYISMYIQPLRSAPPRILPQLARAAVNACMHKCVHVSCCYAVGSL